MKIKDYYKVLGVERTASANDIKKAYYKLINLYHPDKTSDNKKKLEKFIEITEAYKILGDLDNRLKYSIELNKPLLDKALKNKTVDIGINRPDKKKKWNMFKK